MRCLFLVSAIFLAFSLIEFKMSPCYAQESAQEMIDRLNGPDSGFSIDGQPAFYKGSNGQAMYKTDYGTDINNQAVKMVKEGKVDEAAPMFEQAKQLMGDSVESQGPCFVDDPRTKFNREVIQQNVETVNRYQQRAAPGEASTEAARMSASDDSGASSGSCSESGGEQ